MKACLQWINSSVPEKNYFYNCYNRMRNLHKSIGIIWHKNIDRCFSFHVVNAIYNVYIGILSFCGVVIIDEICCMSFDCVAFYLDWYNAIMSRKFFVSWFDNFYCCLLFTVSGMCEKSAILLYIAIVSLSQALDSENFFCTSILNIISVSSSLLDIMKLGVNLKSAFLRWSAVIPNALIGDPSAVFNVVVVSCIGVLKLLSINWYVEYLMRDMAAPESIRAL